MRRGVNHRRVPLLALLGLVLAALGPLADAQEATPPAAGTPAGSLPAGTTVVATGLANPRSVAIADDGRIYVSGAGLGDEPFESPAFAPSSRGTTGQVSRIDPGGTPPVVAADLPSFALGGSEVVGPAGLVAADGALWLVNSHHLPGLTPRPNKAALLRIDPSGGAVATVADLSAFERENNPDGFGVEAATGTVAQPGVRMPRASWRRSAPGKGQRARRHRQGLDDRGGRGP